MDILTINLNQMVFNVIKDSNGVKLNPTQELIKPSIGQTAFLNKFSPFKEKCSSGQVFKKKELIKNLVFDHIISF